MSAKNVGTAPIIIETEDAPILNGQQIEDSETNEVPLDNEQYVEPQQPHEENIEP
jgi:hypothetical protein